MYCREVLTACTELGSVSHALYMVSTYAELDPLRKGSAAVELFSLWAFTVTAAACNRTRNKITIIQ